MPNPIPSSVGVIIVAVIALFAGVFLAVMSWRVKQEPWNKWGTAISCIVFFHAGAVFFQFYLAEGALNLLCEHIQISCFVLLIHACYKFTTNYLGIDPALHQKEITLVHGLLFLATWWPGLVIQQTFSYRHFLWLSNPYIEPPLTLFGKILLFYLGCFALYMIGLWHGEKDSAGIEGKFFFLGFGLWFLFCLHDLICSFGFESVQYLSVYGFLGFIIAIFGITMVKHIDMYNAVELSARALSRSKNELELKIKERTRDLSWGNKKLQTLVERLKKSEERISILSDQTEQFSRAAASMLLIENEQEFFDTLCDVIVKYSDYNRVLMSLFKPSPPFRDIIGYGGVDAKIVDRLRTVEMPASQYDHVFERGRKLGGQSYYIPHTMKEILKQEATVYGGGRLPETENGWHPEDNLFVKMINEKGEFIGVISVDESKSGLRPTDETVRPLEIFSSLISQIIVSKKEQKKNQKLEEQLMQARKMESIGTLTGGIAHDFNNILGVIIGNAELSLARMEKGNEMYSDLESIKYAGNKAADIVKQLLSFGEKSDLALMPVKVDGILEDLLGLIKATLPSTVDIKTDFNPGQSVIMADPVQLNQVFLNLCLNAAQAMGDRDGILTLSCDTLYLEGDTLYDVPELSQGRHIRITVSDNGPGISPDILDRIFDPYFTTKEMGKGSGIGLAVVHGIVKNHHGAVNVNTCPGKGTRFDVLFPVVDREPEKIEARQASVEMGNQETVLLVDDEPMVLYIMGKILNQLGYRVVEALSPEKALEIFTAGPEKFDLVITDMTMPRMSGMVLTRKMQKIDPEKPIIICTGYNDGINGKTPKDLRVSALMMKPVRMGTLSTEIKRVLESK